MGVLCGKEPFSLEFKLQAFSINLKD